MVHEGIAKQYLGCREEFLNLCYGEGVKKIRLAGFSLGGGLTQLACEDAAYHFPGLDIQAISYEGPRVFTKNTHVEELVTPRMTLVKTWNDPVVHVPLKAMGFVDYGTIVWIGKWWRLLPLQHFPEQVEKNLFEKFGE